MGDAASATMWPMTTIRALSAAGTAIALTLAIVGPFRVIALAALAGAIVGLLLRGVVPPRRNN